ncbi:uncharacterized protein LACBIDRAFT_329716 [Laccaria bicolor S238N-H82]|uniref:Predicted protein n=1 Tax=Laccaria bicolor (strain S238N-H82 / ATCC MYA-4686) TaxID=486041 RepID=B0DIZ0_LACBS|nr:uncharacterized protein LACBIDRAFT_329716 [Laccaria bicolor S238N-H82]EDR05427.1 predicted protein [Laccaria bicolor S238N-H82]|eukprot:XP_001883985.1 predicted protein [Laccaria bicolor S238N-H82]
MDSWHFSSSIVRSQLSFRNLIISPIPDNLGFELPGIKSRGYGAYSIASALVHSGRFNIRGREYHSYGFCAMALQDLVDDLAPTALVIPQFELDAFTVSHPTSISLTDSIASLPQLKARGPIPDFSIILVRAILSATGLPIPRGMRLDSFEHWQNVKIEKLVVGLVAEVKRRATRSATSPEEFVTSLRGRIQDARVDAVDQAAAAFLAHEGTNRFILLAWSGEWYSWRMGVRKDFLVKAMPRRQIVSENEGGEAHEEAEEVPASNAKSGTQVSSELSSEEEASVPGPQTATSRERDGKDLDPATHRPTTTGKPELPSRASRSQEAKVEGFYTYKDPLGDITDKKIPYNPNLNPKPNAQKSKKKSKGKGKETEETKPPPKPKKATFRRYTPDDLMGVMEMQRLLTPEECNDPNLFRFKWSDPILFGTPESKQHWSLIHGFLERENTRTFNMSNVSGNDDSREDDSSEDEDDSDQNEDGRHNEGEENEQDGDLDNYSTESSGDEYAPSLEF